MNITLYKYEHERNLMNKTNYLLEPLNLTNVILKDRTSITSPVLLISNLGLDGNSQIEYNYIYIQEFGRYYFVEDIVQENNTLWSFYCSVDVLFTYRNELLQLTGLVNRNENNYNELIIDTFMDTEVEEGIDVVKLILDLGDFTFKTSGYNGGETNIVLTAFNNKYNNYSDTDSPTTYPISILPTVSKYVQANDLFTYKYVLDHTNAWMLAAAVSGRTEAEFIKSLIVFPFIIDTATYTEDGVTRHYTEQVRLGTEDIEYYDVNVVANFPKKVNHMYKKLGKFNYAHSYPNYTHFEPYSQYEIWIPFVGWKSISSADLHNKDIWIFYDINLETGDAIAKLISNAQASTGNQYVIASYNCKIGIKVGVSQSNQEQIDNQVAVNILQTSLGVLSGALITLASGGTGVAAAAGIGAMLSSVGNAVNKGVNLYEHANVSISTGFEGLFNPMDVYIKRTYKKTVEGLNTYNSVKGRPCAKMLQLNTVTGYTEVSEIHLSNIKATSKEKELLLEILKRGFICG